MKRWKHAYAFGGGVGLGLVAAPHAWLIFLAGLLAGAALVLAGKLAVRLVRRIDRALPDAARERYDSGPLVEDPDYLDGAELGVRSARKTVGRSDGRRAELDRLGFGAAQSNDIPF